MAYRQGLVSVLLPAGLELEGYLLQRDVEGAEGDQEVEQQIGALLDAFDQ